MKHEGYELILLAPYASLETELATLRNFSDLSMNMFEWLEHGTPAFDKATTEIKNTIQQANSMIPSSFKSEKKALGKCSLGIFNGNINLTQKYARNGTNPASMTLRYGMYTIGLGSEYFTVISSEGDQRPIVLEVFTRTQSGATGFMANLKKKKMTRSSDEGDWTSDTWHDTMVAIDFWECEAQRSQANEVLLELGATEIKNGCLTECMTGLDSGSQVLSNYIMGLVSVEVVDDSDADKCTCNNGEDDTCVACKWWYISPDLSSPYTFFIDVERTKELAETAYAKTIGTALSKYVFPNMDTAEDVFMQGSEILAEVASGIFGFYGAVFTGDFEEALDDITSVYDELVSSGVYDTITDGVDDAVDTVSDGFSDAYSYVFGKEVAARELSSFDEAVAVAMFIDPSLSIEDAELQVEENIITSLQCVASIYEVAGVAMEEYVQLSDPEKALAQAEASMLYAIAMAEVEVLKEVWEGEHMNMYTNTACSQRNEATIEGISLEEAYLECYDNEDYVSFERKDATYNEDDNTYTFQFSTSCTTEYSEEYDNYTLYVKKSADINSYNTYETTACSGRNEIDSQDGITFAAAAKICYEDDNCLSFELLSSTCDSETSDGDPECKFQFSTSCTPEFSKSSSGWTLYVKPSADINSYTAYENTACSGRNEIESQDGITFAAAAKICYEDDNCLSFELKSSTCDSETSDGDPLCKFQFSTSCTPEYSGTYSGWTLYMKN